MPVVQCECGAQTNSAVSIYWTRKDWKVDLAEGCYVKFVDGKWEKGCRYHRLKEGEFWKQMADKMMREVRDGRVD